MSTTLSTFARFVAEAQGEINSKRTRIARAVIDDSNYRLQVAERIVEEAQSRGTQCVLEDILPLLTSQANVEAGLRPGGLLSDRAPSSQTAGGLVHDLQTPLRAIQRFPDIFLEDSFSSVEIPGHLAMLYTTITDPGSF